ncbi:recombination protein O N-terminal domain-containing protein [Spirochaetia bacterium 38H-sp]|uniref:DNA repair protein RecO n=1 Tax=Rarispira pelagica TaxID=3141764 RepID=A0ABU9UCT0_9SPIR
MRRNKHYKAIVLSSRSFGEHNRYISLLTQEGIIDAAVYGARKPSSRFAPASQIGAAGDYYLYYNPVKDNYKLTDTAGTKLLASSVLPVSASFIFFSELVLSTHAAGQPKEVWKLAIWLWRRLFIGLEEDGTFVAKSGGADITLSPIKTYNLHRLTMFLLYTALHYMEIMGLLPDWQTCSHCTKSLAKQPAIWTETGLLCPACSGTSAEYTHGRITLTAAQRTILSDIAEGRQNPDTHPLSSPDLYSATLNLLLEKTERIAERRIKSLIFLRQCLSL